MIQQRLSVKGGRIRVRCKGCKKIKWHTVNKGVCRKAVRCHCGKVTHCTFEYRQCKRESCSIMANVEVGCESIKVYLCDMSTRGVGFTARGRKRSFKVGQRLLIQMKSQLGRKSIRKIRISNVSIDRIGAAYADIPTF